MEEGDRTAIHEVMEQQTISIAKAGITTTLNARAAVLAAANPLYGRYNRKKSVSDNVDLPNSLLSRFDLLFLLLDKVDREADEALSRHVLHVHKYMRNPDSNGSPPLPPSVVKQYIAIAREINPTVPQDLSSYIVEAYVSLRIQDASGAGPDGRYRSSNNSDQTIMTARQLLSILRLSQALARLRLADIITHEDVDEAIRLTHASKASLLDDSPSGPQEDTVSAIYNAIRDMVGEIGASRNVSTVDVPYVQVEAMVLRKGFTAQELKNCLNEYENLGVWALDAERTHLMMDC
jgi:DNA replication licensing factor MCM7